MSDIVIDDSTGLITLAYIDVDPMNSAGSILDSQFTIKSGATAQTSNLTFAVNDLLNSGLNTCCQYSNQGTIRYYLLPQYAYTLNHSRAVNLIMSSAQVK